MGVYMDEQLNAKYLMMMKTIKDEFEHDEADNLLCDLLEELGYTELVDAYRKIPKWYS